MIRTRIASAPPGTTSSTAFRRATDGADAELIATVRSLHASAPDHRPQSEFRDNLREQLMDTAIPSTMPGRAQKVRAQGEFTGVRPIGIGASRSRVPQALRGTAVRWAAIAATIALLLTTLGAGYLGGLIPQGKDPDGDECGRTLPGTPAAGTPVAGTLVDDAATKSADICRAAPTRRSGRHFRSGSFQPRLSM